MRPYMRAANVTWDGISSHDVKEMDFTPAEFETYALRPGVLRRTAPASNAGSDGVRCAGQDLTGAIQGPTLRTEILRHGTG